MAESVLPPGDHATHWLATWHWSARNASNAGETAQTGCRIAWHKPGFGPSSSNATDFLLDARRCVPEFRQIDHSALTINLGHAVGDGVGLPLTSVITDEDVTDVFVAMNNLAVDLKTVWAGGWKLEYLKLAPIGDWNRYPRDCAPHMAVPKVSESVVASNGWSMAHATCVTLGTAKRGRGSTARMYWPYAEAVSSGFSGALTAPQQAKVATFVEKIANPPSGLDVGRWRMRVILGRRNTLSLTAPYHRGSVVNHVRVGDRVDIQRRRMNKRDEVYTRADVPNLD